MGEAKLCKVLCQLIASPPSKYPDLIDDHSFSCHFADTQIFLSTRRRQNNTFKFNFKLSREQICIVFLFCVIGTQVVDCVSKKKALRQSGSYLCLVVDDTAQTFIWNKPLALSMQFPNLFCNSVLHCVHCKENC